MEFSLQEIVTQRKGDYKKYRRTEFRSYGEDNTNIIVANDQTLGTHGCIAL